MLQSKDQSRQCSSPRPVQSAGNTYHGTISKAAQQSIILWFRVRYNQPPSRIIEIDTHTTRPLVLLSVQINKSVSSDVLDTTREPALDNIESNMAPRFAKYLSNLLDPTYCECCDHNLSPVVTEVEAQGESEPAKKSRWIWLGKFGWKKRVDVSRNPRTSDRRISKRRRFAKYLCLGRRREHNEQHRLEASGGAHAVSENQTPSKCPIRQLLDTVFASLVSSDTHLSSQSFTTTQCFLVHIFTDLNPSASFLTHYQHLPAHVEDLVLDEGLSFASTWLQTSLEKIKTECATGGVRLQMPFCVLDTEYAAACKRAGILQADNPEERVGIVALDVVALKKARLLVSAGHAFDFLRVPRGEVEMAGRLLVWAEGGDDGRAAEALSQAVLTVVEWEGVGEKEKVDGVGGNARGGVAVESTLRDSTYRTDQSKPSAKKDPVVTEMEISRRRSSV